MAGNFYEGSDAKLLIDVKALGFSQESDNYTIELYNNDRTYAFTQADVKKDDEGNFILPVVKNNNRIKLEAGSLIAVVTVRIPDEDFPGGYREEKAKPINLGPIMPLMK
jgi:hypothetical protein